MGSMLVVFSLGSSQRVQGFWQGGDNSIVGGGGDKRKYCFFSDAPGMSAFGWDQYTRGNNSRVPGQVPYSSLSAGKKMKSGSKE